MIKPKRFGGAASMEGFHLAIAVGPLALYLLLIGSIRLRPHPFVTSGAKDNATLAIGLVGLMMIGPMELFFPQQAAVTLGAWVWVILLLFYSLCIALWLLTSRRRLVVYGMSETHLRDSLFEVAHAMDSEARWVGDVLQFPTKAINVSLEMSGNRTVGQLLAAGERQDWDSWFEFEERVIAKVGSLPSEDRSSGWMLLATGALMLAAAGWSLLYDLPSSIQAMKEMLRW
jgi:uncharacterized membrane protein